MNATTDGSDSQREQVEEFADVMFQYQLINYVNLAVFVVLLFEYFITLDCEVRLAWGRKLSWARVICLLNRYIALFLYLLSLVPLLPTGNLIGCEAINFTMQTVTVLLYVNWAAFSGLRIYAISSYSRLVTLAVVSLALVAVGTNIYLATQTTDVYAQPFGCLAETSMSSIAFRKCVFILITRGCWLAFETIVIIVTWLKTWNMGRSNLRTSSNISFTALVQREGTIYFGVLASLNAMQIAFALHESTDFSLIIAFADPLIAILISRYYFTLNDLQTEEFTTSLSSTRHVVFRPAISKGTDDLHSELGSWDDPSISYDAPTEDALPPTAPPKDV